MVLLFGLCVYVTDGVKVKFQRQTTSYMGGTSFYHSSDNFDSIGATRADRKQFCIQLNSTCFGSTCLRCGCLRKDIFVSYSLGCRYDIFKGMFIS